MENRVKITIAILIILSILIFIRYRPFEKEIYGTYKNNITQYPDTLVFYHDFTYLHKAKLNDVESSQRGNWSYSGGKVLINDFRRFDNNFQASRLWIVKYNFPGIEIDVNDDTDEAYIHINNK